MTRILALTLAVRGRVQDVPDVPDVAAGAA